MEKFVEKVNKIVMTEEEFAQRIYEAQKSAYEEGKNDGIEMANDECYLRGYQDAIRNFKKFNNIVEHPVKKEITMMDILRMVNY